MRTLRKFSTEFTLEEEIEDLVLAKQTYVDRRIDKPSKEFPPDYAIIIIDKKFRDTKMIIRAKKETLIELGKNLVQLENEEKEE